MKYLKPIALAFVALACYLLAPSIAVAKTIPAATFTATVTKYSSIDSCTSSSCIMANGKSASVGYAACPSRFPLGTKFVTGGYEYICGDRTAKRFDGRFDLFAGYGMHAHARAILWGIQSQEVTIE